MKSYEKEASIYAQRLEPAKVNGNRLIEWGCGTGNFMKYWPQWGWQALGIEPSDPMRKIALSKHLSVVSGTLGSQLPFSATCDAAVACFTVMCYACLTNDSLIRTLCQIRATLPVGGRFAFDVIRTVPQQHL